MGICPRISVSRRASRGARIRKSLRTPPSVALAPRKSRIRANGAPTIPSPTARIAGRASRLLLESPTIARTRRWRLSRCARRAKRNTQTLAIVVSTPKRSPAAPAVQRSHCGVWTGVRRNWKSCPSEECLASARRLIMSGAILALKGLGGYHLACDATDFDAVSRLRRLKRRDAKPFALMARDLGVIKDYCAVGEEEERLLTSPAAPIVLLNASGVKRLPPVVAPSLNALGFMLPTTPLHLLVMQGFAAAAGDDERQSLRRTAGHRRQ